MAHNLFNQRFFNKDRKPAWHGIGITVDEPISAEEAYTRVGAYNVDLVPLYAHLNQKQRLNTGYSIIVRQPTKDDNQLRVFGSPVSRGYELIDAGESARLWDAAMGNKSGTVATPTETLGVLGKGEEIFITTKARVLNIAGDEVEAYEFMYSPMFSGKAAIIGVTCIRVVCANTLRAGIANAVQRYYINHLKGAKVALRKQLEDMHNANQTTIELANEAFTLLAKKKMKGDENVNRALNLIYPEPQHPQEDWNMRFGITYAQHMERYEEKCQKLDQIRDTVFDLYMGGGRGMDTVAVQGTAFGVYNAVAEFETYRKGAYERAAVNLVVGDRALSIQRAFNVLSTFSPN